MPLAHQEQTLLLLVSAICMSKYEIEGKSHECNYSSLLPLLDTQSSTLGRSWTCQWSASCCRASVLSDVLFVVHVRSAGYGTENQDTWFLFSACVAPYQAEHHGLTSCWALQICTFSETRTRASKLWSAADNHVINVPVTSLALGHNFQNQHTRQ